MTDKQPKEAQVTDSGPPITSGLTFDSDRDGWENAPVYWTYKRPGRMFIFHRALDEEELKAMELWLKQNPPAPPRLTLWQRFKRLFGR